MRTLRARSQMIQPLFLITRHQKYRHIIFPSRLELDLRMNTFYGRGAQLNSLCGPKKNLHARGPQLICFYILKDAFMKQTS